MTLPVPAESMEEWTRQVRHGAEDPHDEAVRAIAGPVVVAVLRELADGIDVYPAGALAGWLRGRADEIERETTEGR